MQFVKPIQLAFFSYAHEDAEFSLRLAKDLRAGGAAVWMDRLDIKPGQRWDRAVEDALAKCPELLVILSPAAVESTHVMDEVSFALGEGKTVLPVKYRDCKIPFRLRRLQYVDLTLNYNEGLGRLLETLGVAAPTSELPQAAPQEGQTTLPMPKKRAFGPVIGTIGAVLEVTIFLALASKNLDRQGHITAAFLYLVALVLGVIAWREPRDGRSGVRSLGIVVCILAALGFFAAVGGMGSATAIPRATASWAEGGRRSSWADPGGNHVFIKNRSLKRTYVKVTVDGRGPAFERWISPGDRVGFVGKHFSIHVLDRDAVEITKNGRTLEAGDEDVTVD